MMDDYYELLGVEPDAPTDEIRTAYRERRASIDATNDAGRADSAKLNRAWNVLSDPYQRGRYDEQRAQGDGEGEDDLELSANGKATAAKSTRPARQRRPPGPPTITPPAGTTFPVPKQRVIAMVIDVGVLLVLFIVATYFVAPAIARAVDKTTVDNVKVLDHQRDDLGRQQDDAKTALDNAKKGTDQDAIAQAQRDYDNAKRAYDDKNGEITKEANKLQPIYYGVFGGYFLLGMMYLVVPTIASGRTLGKRFQHIRVLRDDGSPLRAGDAIKRYGTPVLVTFALFLIGLGPLAGAIVIVGVIGWTRNANMQSMLDRFAHTIVVADANS